MGKMKLGNRDHHHLMFHVDDGFPTATLDVPASLEQMLDRCVGWCTDTQVNVLNYHLNEITETRDEAGEDANPPYNDLMRWRQKKHEENLLAKGLDYTNEAIDATRKAGIAFFAGVRMNDVHHCSRARHPKFWVDHPEFRIGEDRPWDARWKGALDFAHPEVREYRKEIIRDVLDRWDVDGLELDFNRMPLLFKEAEADVHRDTMTAWIGEIRDLLSEVGGRRGHPIPLEVRVPSVAEVCHRIGIDILTWIREDMVDIATCSGIRYAEFEMPVDAFVEAAKATDVLVFAGFEPRLTSSISLLTVDMWRAAATHYWKAGVDGLHIFNGGNYYFWNALEMPHLHEMADPEVMARKDKKYQVSRRTEWAGKELPQFTYPKPLPCPLEASTGGTGIKIRIHVDDEIEGARQEGILSGVTLRLRINNITADDELKVELNGIRLPKESSRTEYVWGQNANPIGSYLRGAGFGAQWISFDVTEGPEVLAGENEVEVVLREKNPNLSVQLELDNVEILVNYV